ncbi:glycosyltransferase family 4 protein [Haliea sp. E17]|uniref:glycosyltransferase family 4 protein n=1 Tax=Haliea sp. E17 TaxID=3401576 RepID=UPI003AAA9C3D
MKVAFVSTSIAPYTIPSRVMINSDKRLECIHLFARKIEPGRQWYIGDVPENFYVVKGVTLRFFRRFIYVPIQLPVTLKKYRPKVIVSEQLGSLLFFTLLYALSADIPVYLRWEGTPTTERRFNGRFRLAVRKWLGRNVKGFLCYSNESIRYLESIGMDQPKRMISYPVTSNIFYPPENMNQRSSEVFLYVGQLIPRKGITQLIKAFLLLVENYPKATLWIVGDGELRGSIEEQIPEQYSRNFVLHGFRSELEVAELMRSAGNFVCPTLEDHGPVVQIEAAMTGLPILGSIYSGNANLVINDGENGLIIDPNDEQQFFDGLKLLCDTKCLIKRDRMYQLSIEKAGKHGVPSEVESTVNALLEMEIAGS